RPYRSAAALALRLRLVCWLCISGRGLLRCDAKASCDGSEIAGCASVPTMIVSAQAILARCRRIAAFSESSTETTRTFLCPAMRDVHRSLGDWMQSLGMDVTVDAIGNLR